MSYYIGIDIGSTGAKTAVMSENRDILFTDVRPTGWSSADTAEAIRKTLTENGFDPTSAKTVATGYGRISVPFADRTVTEITCHARGAAEIFNEKNMTVIDIGGQDTKVIALSNGSVSDFVMNDKCSAGTGRFLEVMANTLGVSIETLCEMASRGKVTHISSMCTVFAESEVISLIGSGEPRENIAYAVVDSILQKVTVQAKRLDGTLTGACLTGGLCGLEFVRKRLSEMLGCAVATSPLARYAGAVGAAISAMKLK